MSIISVDYAYDSSALAYMIAGLKKKPLYRPLNANNFFVTMEIFLGKGKVTSKKSFEKSPTRGEFYDCVFLYGETLETTKNPKE